MKYIPRLATLPLLSHLNPNSAHGQIIVGLSPPEGLGANSCLTCSVHLNSLCQQTCPAIDQTVDTVVSYEWSVGYYMSCPSGRYT